jgi:hypothetical protein
MSNKRHLEYIYNRLVNVYDEPENIDYMLKFKSTIEDLQLQEAYLLDVVHNLAKLRIHPMQQDLYKYMSEKDFKMDDELKMLVEALKEKEEAIYKQYGISRQRCGKIE